MFIYFTTATTALTWLILIRPNSYTTASNAVSWLLAMTIFVFLPMLIFTMDNYMQRLERERHKTTREYRQAKAQRAGCRLSESQDDERVQFTSAYCRQRFMSSEGADKKTPAARHAVQV